MSIRFVPAALLAVMIALVAVGGAALAFGRVHSDPEQTNDLLDRAAVELGIEPQALKDALAQAESELEAERVQAVLDDLVADEVITQEQADEAAAWFAQKPDVIDDVVQSDAVLRLAIETGPAVIAGDLRGGNFVPGSVFGDELTAKMAEILGVDPDDLDEALSNARDGQQQDAREQAINDFIDKLVDEGEITEAEGVEIKTWIDAMPEWLSQDGMLFRLFARGVVHEVDAGAFGAIPGLDGLFIRPDGAPFGAPRGEFRGPDFNFAIPSDPQSGEQFFYRGPEGEFQFDGEVPPEFEDLFKRFQFGSGELGDLFDQFRFIVPPTPEDPAGSSNSGSDASIPGA